MRKNYELLEVKIVSFDNEDIIVTSGAVEPVEPSEPTPSSNAINSDNLLGGNFDLGGLDTQNF